MGDVVVITHQNKHFLPIGEACKVLHINKNSITVKGLTTHISQLVHPRECKPIRYMKSDLWKALEGYDEIQRG